MIMPMIMREYNSIKTRQVITINRRGVKKDPSPQSIKTGKMQPKKKTENKDQEDATQKENRR